MRKIGLITAVGMELVAYASAQTPSGNRACANRDWMTMSQ